jgi:hypothetical protein
VAGFKFESNLGLILFRVEEVCFFPPHEKIRNGRTLVVWSRLSANLRELAVGQRLGEDAVVDEAEGIPLGGTFGLEVPEDPTKTMLAMNSMFDFLDCKELTIH